MKKYRIFAYTFVLVLVLGLILIPAPPVTAATYSVMVLPTPPKSDYSQRIHRDSPAYIIINQDADRDINVSVDTGVDTLSSSCQVNWTDSSGENTMTCSGIDTGSFYWKTVTYAGKSYTQHMPDIRIDNNFNNTADSDTRLQSCSPAAAIPQSHLVENDSNINSSCLYPLEYRDWQSAAVTVIGHETAGDESLNTYFNNGYPKLIAYPQAGGSAGSISISPAQKTVEQGSDFSIVVELNTTVPTSGAAFQMTWTGIDNNGNPANLVCTGMQAGSFYPGASFGYSDNGTTGQSTIGLFGATDVPAQRDGLAIIYFAAETPGTYNIHLYDCESSNRQGELFTLDITDGLVEVTAAEEEPVGILSISPVEKEVNLNDPFDIDVLMIATDNISGVGFQMTWTGQDETGSPVNLDYQGITVVDEFKSGLVIPWSNNETGSTSQYAVTLTGDYIAAGEECVVATVSFSSQYKGTYTLHLHDCQISKDGSDLTVGTEDGMVEVTEPRMEPLPPTGLAATKIGTNQVDLKWNDISQSPNEDYFNLERADAGDFQIIAQPGTNNTTFIDYTVLPDTTYYYHISAVREVNSIEYKSDLSNTIEVITWPLIPYAPYNLHIDTVELGKVEIAWEEDSPNELGLRIERASDEDFKEDVVKFYVGASADDYKDSTIEPGESYYYRVFAYNALGDSLPSESIYVYTMPGAPEAPYDLFINEVTSDYVKLEWDDGANNEDGFIVERALSKKFDLEKKTRFRIKGSNVSKFTDDSVKDGNYYFYRVAAYNRYGESDFALSAYNQLGGTSKVKYVEVNVPARPTELFGELQGYLQVDLSWEDNEDDEEGYHIERALDVEFTLEVIDYYVSADAFNYSDTNTEANTTYYYRVYTLNKDSDYIDSESPASNVVSLTTGTPPDPDDIKRGELDISASVDDNGITGKNITITNLIGVKSLDITADNQLLTYNDMPLTTIGSSLVQLDTLSLLKQRVIALPDKVFKPGENSPIPPVSITQEYSAQIIGPVVELQPSGSVFARPVTLTLEYDPDSYPAALSRQDLVLAYYDAHADKWIELPSTVNTVGHTVSAEISHFSTLGIIKKVDRVVEWWRVGAIMAAEMVLGLLIYIFIIIRRRSRYY